VGVLLGRSSTILRDIQAASLAEQKKEKKERKSPSGPKPIKGYQLPVRGDDFTPRLYKTGEGREEFEGDHITQRAKENVKDVFWWAFEKRDKGEVRAEKDQEIERELRRPGNTLEQLRHPLSEDRAKMVRGRMTNEAYREEGLVRRKNPPELVGEGLELYPRGAIDKLRELFEKSKHPKVQTALMMEIVKQFGKDDPDLVHEIVREGLLDHTSPFHKAVGSPHTITTAAGKKWEGSGLFGRLRYGVRRNLEGDATQAPLGSFKSDMAGYERHLREIDELTAPERFSRAALANDPRLGDKIIKAQRVLDLIGSRRGGYGDHAERLERELRGPSTKAKSRVEGGSIIPGPGVYREALVRGDSKIRDAYREIHPAAADMEKAPLFRDVILKKAAPHLEVVRKALGAEQKQKDLTPKLADMPLWARKMKAGGIQGGQKQYRKPEWDATEAEARNTLYQSELKGLAPWVGKTLKKDMKPAQVQKAGVPPQLVRIISILLKSR